MLEAGATIAGKYQLERQLGEGGMGVVWLARHIELGDRRVAIKFLLNSVSKTLIERFRREALLASRIQSRHVVQVLDFGEHQGAPYLVMECLEGDDLRHLLDRQRAVDPGSVVAIVGQAARGLQKAHDAGMIHRDIKPENLFLCRDEDGGLLVKILDFGIAKSLEVESGTATGMMIGTAYYMSPEQFQGLKGIDRRTDLWSLACVAYEMLMGARVFDGESVIAIGMYILSEKRPVPSQRATGVPASFDSWFAKALHPNLANRFNSASELAESLAIALGVSRSSAGVSFTTGAEGTASTPAREFTTAALANSEVSTSTKAPGSRGRWVVAAGVIGVIALVVAGVLAALRQSSRGAAQQASLVTDVQSAASFPAASSSALDGELSRLAKAVELIRQGDAVAAHGLLSDVPSDSPMRVDVRFAQVENAWADLQLSKAEGESDPTQRRRTLSEVVASGADEARRMRARSLLDAPSAVRSVAKGAKSVAPSKTAASEPTKPAGADPAKGAAAPTGTLPPRF
jgi:serine/threonine-protein kinase